MNKDLGIGFIDLLTGFLCSTIVLMLIYSYSKNKSADQNEATDSFFLIELKVPKNELKLRFDLQSLINEDIVGNKVIDGEIITNNGFNILDRTFEENVYIYGPVKSNKDDYNHYKIYSPGISKKHHGNWKIKVTYYDDNRLEKSTNISSIITKPSIVSYNLHTKDGSEKDKILKLKLGQQESIPFIIN